MKRTLSLLLLFPILFSSAQVNLNLGLIAHYPLDGNANDISGNSINGVITNATTTTDRAGNANSAYYFNGSNAYIQLPYSNLYNFAPQDSFSISAWILPDAGNPWPAQSVVVKSPPNSDFNHSDWNYGVYMLNYKAMGGFAYNNVVNGTTTLNPNPCWYNLVLTYKNGVWKLYVNGNIESSDLTQTRFILQDGSASKIAIGKKGESFGDFFKGKIDEIRLYNRVLNQAEVTAIVGFCAVACPQKNDFSFERNSCDPFNVAFSTSATGYSNIKWDFGDATTANAVAVANHTYATPGNYQVSLIIGYPSCSDTIKKTITIDIQNDPQLISTADGVVCKGASKQLQSTAGLNFCWTPATFLSNSNIPNPVTNTPQNITYYLTSLTYGANLINNGDFTTGNSGFSSQYTFANPNTTEGQYFVGTSPQAWNASLSNCTDHTSGSGNMMLVNGSPTPDINVWSQTVNVTPNTNYAFSTWIQALWPPNPAQLSFSINNNTVGALITASLPTCTWSQFYTNWNSGNSTTATISIVNKNTQIQGNDFALDDILFAPVFMKRDSVKITLEDPVVVTTNNTSICSGRSVQLNTTGAASYSWSPATGLSNPAIANPVATPLLSTQYIVTGTTSNGCIGKDTVDITINPSPVITKSVDTTICIGGSANLSVSGGGTYSWTPGASLSNPNIANPVATPTVNTKYYVTVTGANTCTTVDSIKVDVRAAANFTVNPPVDVCLKKSVQLNATGGDLYTWQPAASLDNAIIPNPFASPTTTTTYSVHIRDTLCGNSTDLSTIVSVLALPTIRASKSNDIDCSISQSQLQATGGIQYDWTPAGSLNNPSIQGPVATPLITTLYTVSGTDVNGCNNTDTVTVKVTNINNGGYLMPSAFTPNNDGLNDCYGIKYWGVIEKLDFRIYNRWGEMVFRTTNPAGCWDGTYKGVKQDANVFVYMINATTSCQGAVSRKGTFMLIR